MCNECKDCGTPPITSDDVVAAALQHENNWMLDSSRQIPEDKKHCNEDYKSGYRSGYMGAMFWFRMLANCQQAHVRQEFLKKEAISIEDVLSEILHKEALYGHKPKSLKTLGQLEANLTKDEVSIYNSGYYDAITNLMWVIGHRHFSKKATTTDRSADN